MPQFKASKTEKLDIRLNENEQLLIRQAASIVHKTPTGFVREKALEAAESIIHDQNKFVLTKEHWDAINAAFDSPIRPLPKLEKRLSEPDEWD